MIQAVVGHDVAVLVIGVRDLVEAVLADQAEFGVGYLNLGAVLGVGQLLAVVTLGLEAGNAGLAVGGVGGGAVLVHGVALIAVVDGEYALVRNVFHLAVVPVALDLV